MKIGNILQQTVLFSCLLFVSFTVSGFAQNSDNAASESKTITKGKYTLIFESKDPSFSKELSQILIDTHFKVYPTLVKTFNKDSRDTIRFVIDPNYDGVAVTSNGRVVYSSKYMTKNPGDIDVVTHEVMHIVQGYGGRSGMPGWLTEGIADYVRYEYGVANPAGGWRLPKFSESHSYTNSYRIAARFLVWLENSGHKGIVKKLDQAGRDRTYEQGALWQKLTGKTVDELWADYVKAGGGKEIAEK